MRTREEVINSQIDEIMDCFDFERVRVMMKATNWFWASSSSEDGIPESYEIRMRAREILKRAHESEFSSCGGFTMRRIEGEEGGEKFVRISLQWGPGWDIDEGESYK